MALMVYFTFKYRRRPGAVPLRSANHNTILELSWSVIPTILLVWMFFEGFWGFADQIVAPGEAPEFVVTARKWSWSLTYPNGATSPVSTRSRAIDGAEPIVDAKGRKLEAAAETPIFVVPEDKPIRLRMSTST
jgi:heme/copper-type cytochrome/quinol oxidase subunit 2